MSDIVIVSQDEFRNPEAARHVKYGTPQAGLVEGAVDVQPVTMEGIQDGAVQAVDWRGIDSRNRGGRPRGSKNKPKAGGK